MSNPKFSAEFLAQQTRDAALARWRDDLVRERVITGIRAGHGQTPEARRATSERLKAQWKDPEWAARQRAKIREALTRPETRAKITAAMRHPDRRVAQALAAKQTWEGKVRVRRVRGPFMRGETPIRCECCGRSFGARLKPERDHRLAIMFGGGDSATNANYLCQHCHSYKTSVELRILHALNRG